MGVRVGCGGEENQVTVQDDRDIAMIHVTGRHGVVIFPIKAPPGAGCTIRILILLGLTYVVGGKRNKKGPTGN